ncbi:MAG: hypothetical protein IPG70_02945 [Moraxellaceae bacterium]|nr:hypothetical protein [Moraxellaceae bacterium]
MVKEDAPVVNNAAIPNDATPAANEATLNVEVYNNNSADYWPSRCAW